MERIGFKQYLRPDARERKIEIDMSPEVQALALEFIEAGGRFECEELRTGEASLTAVHDLEGEPADIAMR